MSALDPILLNRDALLGMNKYQLDEDNAHIELIDDPDSEEFVKLVLACPAALYRIDDEGRKSFDYAGCLECGTCRVICNETIIKKWEMPRGGMGVTYRYG